MNGTETAIIDLLLKNEPKDIKNKVIKNIEDFKVFANIEVIETSFKYIIWNELQKVKGNC